MSDEAINHMIALEPCMESLLGDFFADNQITPEMATVMLASAVGRLIAAHTGTDDETRRNLATIVEILQSHMQPSGNETAH